MRHIHHIRPVEGEGDCCSHMELPAGEGGHRILAAHYRIAVVHKVVAARMTAADILLDCTLGEDNLGLVNVIEEDIHNRRRHRDVAGLRSRPGQDRTTLHFSECMCICVCVSVCVYGGVEKTEEGMVRSIGDVRDERKNVDNIKRRKGSGCKHDDFRVKAKQLGVCWAQYAVRRISVGRVGFAKFGSKSREARQNGRSYRKL